MDCDDRTPGSQPVGAASRYELIGATDQLVPSSGLVRPIGAAQTHEEAGSLILCVEGARSDHNSIELAVSANVVGFPRIHEN